MKQTTNYHLNQWDPGDRLLRTDFNGDNGKIDAAIRAAENRINSFSNQLSSTVSNVNSQISSAMSTINNKIATMEGKLGMKLIRTLTNSEATQNITFQISGIDWSKYQRVYMEVLPKCRDGANVSTYLNGQEPQYFGGFSYSSGSRVSFWVVLHPMHNASFLITTLILSGGTPCRDFQCPYSGFNSLRLGCNNGDHFESGSVLKFYGEE